MKSENHAYFSRTNSMAYRVYLAYSRDQTHLVRAFATPTLRKKREGWGTPYVGNARKIKNLGHPPSPSTFGRTEGFPVRSGGA